MRNTMWILLGALSACAAQQPRSVVYEGRARYACVDLSITRDGERLFTTVDAGRPEAPMRQSWRDAEGDHFVAFPTAVTDVDAIEYIFPHDTRADAIERRYDTSKGQSSADWRLVHQRTCRVHGGYSDAFARWASGSSLDDIRASLALGSRAEARDLVHRALVTFNKRYYGE